MARPRLAVSVAALLLACGGAIFARQTENFNREWKFSLGDPAGAEARNYNDAGWETVGLPHTFSLPYFRSAQFCIGYGWYRKHFTANENRRNQRLLLEFDGAFQDAEIYVNGRRMGEHQGGYTGFFFDITEAVTSGENVLAVRLNNNWNARLAPRAGEHEFCGGIYREVRLVIVDTLNVTWNVTFVTTPQVSAEAARVDMKTEVKNDGREGKRCTVLTSITDPDGQRVTEMRSTQTIAPGKAVTFDQTSEAIPH
jgi:beta-galactosidase